MPLPGALASQRTPLLCREASLEACTERMALAAVAAAYSGGGAAGRLAAAALGGGQRQWQLLNSLLRWAAGAQHLKVETYQRHDMHDVVSAYTKSPDGTASHVLAAEYSHAKRDPPCVTSATYEEYCKGLAVILNLYI